MRASLKMKNSKGSGKMTCCARWTQIQDDAFNVKILFGLQLAKGLLERTRGAGLRRGGQLRAAAPIRAQIQNSKFKISAYRVYFGIYSDSGCSLRRARTMRTCGTRAAGLRRWEAAAR